MTADISIYAGIYVKTFVVPDRGTLVPQHSHQWPHISYLVSGAMRVWCGDEQLGDFAAPCAIRIAAHEKHSFLTLTDNVTILCIHNADHLDEAEGPAVAELHELDLED
jgi:quercetin dioxygenase-like cupin family protein